MGANSQLAERERALKGKQFSIAMLLALFLLTVASAQWSGQQSNNSYDAWLDYNDDGLIDVYELHQIGQAYGSSGEPARNVTVSSHATSYIRLGGTSNISVPALSTWWSESILIDGYAKVTIMTRDSVLGFLVLELYACDNEGHEWFIDKPERPNGCLVKTYDVMSPRIRIRIYNSSNTAITVDIAFYLMA